LKKVNWILILTGRIGQTDVFIRTGINKKLFGKNTAKLVIIKAWLNQIF